MERIPLHLILGGVTFGDPPTAIRDGRYRINPIVAANPRDQSIILAQPLGARRAPVLGDARHARRRTRHARHPRPRARDARRDPDFALLFPAWAAARPSTAAATATSTW